MKSGIYVFVLGLKNPISHRCRDKACLVSLSFLAALSFFTTIAFSQPYILTWICSKGSAEDELYDGVAKYAKLRPMRVEMYGTNYRQN